jgi:hypothetical protein
MRDQPGEDLVTVLGFDRVDDERRCAIGGSSLTGALSLVAVVKRISEHSAAPSEEYFTIMANHSSGGLSVLGLEFASGDFVVPAGSLYFESGGGTGADSGTSTVLPSDGWVIVGVSRAAGTTTPRFHIYRSLDQTWTHVDGAGTTPNPTAQATIRFGGRQDGARLGALLAVAAQYDAALSDAQFETLNGGYRWSYGVLGPTALWEFNLPSVETPLNDMMGTADEIEGVGTTVVFNDDPPVDVYYFDRQILNTATQEVV